jgi:ATP-dependent helicase/nuclease subunit A
VPLLEELAAGQNERQRSVFLVGDRKQSIYGFRRAAPELFDAAQDWMRQSLDAVSQPLSTSWRSAPAIMQCVNWVFGDGPLSRHIHQFDTHDTYHKNLWGRVEILPLVEEIAKTPVEKTEPQTLRNPLNMPRPETEDTRHYEEGRLVAAKILSLVSQPTLIGKDKEVRKLDYKDIMILLRHRTHASAYERALREARIPYVGAERGTLLDTLEIRDMIALLETLVTPYNNLAQAVVLRSPIFSCSNEQLMMLAQLQQGTWLQRLQAIAQQQSPPPELLRAHKLLPGWNALAGILPVHDLLDRIYNQGNILNRYEASYPSHLKQRVRANLSRFIELALEVDSGRYPSIGNFLSRLKFLRDQTQNGPDEVAASDSQSRVRIMTIHASKGMEAPVVFLADACNSENSAKAYQAFVDWPAEQPRPHSYLLIPPKKRQDDTMQQWLARNREKEFKEESNLLYVALTRAKQILFISGCEPNRGNNLGWYGQIREQLGFHLGLEEMNDQHGIVYQTGEPPQIEAQESLIQGQNAAAPIAATNNHLKGPFPRVGVVKEIAPSYERPIAAGATTENSGPHMSETMCGEKSVLDEDKQTKGNTIHSILHLLCEHVAETDVIERIRAEYGLNLRADPWSQWLAEAKRVITNPAWEFLYNPTHYKFAYNEVPLMYRQNADTVYGFIDRLVVTDERLIVVDYKTHAVQKQSDVDLQTTRYIPQLRLYKQGIAKCWPNTPIDCYLLFTHNAHLQFVQI